MLLCLGGKLEKHAVVESQISFRSAPVSYIILRVSVNHNFRYHLGVISKCLGHFCVQTLVALEKLLPLSYLKKLVNRCHVHMVKATQNTKPENSRTI